MNNILIVEDEAVNIAIYESLLEDDYNLIIARTAQESLRILQDHDVDILLLDVILPDGNGIDLCRQLKEDNAYKHLPIIIVTSLGNPEYKLQGLAAGANDLINKPFDKVELLLKVDNHLQIKRLSNELNDSFDNITTINNISNRIMKGFNPRYFDFSRDLFTLLKGYTSQVRKHNELPACIYISLENSEQGSRASMYKITNAEPEPIGSFDSLWKMPVHSPTKLTEDEDVVFINREDTDESHTRFQMRFPAEILDKTGPVFNYIGYNGPEVCIIGFNFKKPVNRFMAQTLKSFALNGNFFKVIRDQVDEVKEAHLYTLSTLARAAEASDSYTGEHIARVNHYSGFIAKQLQLPERIISDISNMAQMHDIGKINIHPDILRKKGALSSDEWEEMKKHPVYGARILGESKYMRIARNICMAHHENFDGTGYPMGITGNEIPIEARIVRMADVYDALRSTRTYKPSFAHNRSKDIILNGSEIIKPDFFDPNILEVFRTHHLEFNRIYSELA